MVIYSQRLAGKLMMRGFILQEIGIDKRNNKKNVFYFKNSEELKIAIQELQNK